MVESDKEYVLQWSGHAAHVTERFSGLLARQALVDVTLICQGQKLRVHKLVLASCSLYFEEMLEQDLGQEPIIFLRDLDFEVLKAMVEFMYCGETTISHCHLQTLLDAAQVFKVKELECIVDSMLNVEQTTDSDSRKKENSEGVISSSSDGKRNVMKTRPSGERFDEKSALSDMNDDAISESKDDRSLNDNPRTNYGENDDESSLYETIDMVNEVSALSPKEDQESSDSNSVATLDSSYSESSKMCTSEDDDEALIARERPQSPADDNVLKSIFIERRYNYLDDAKLRETVESQKQNLSHKYDNQELFNGVGECSKVYSHKKRKFANNKKYTEDNLSDSASSRMDDESLTDYSPDCSDNGSTRIAKKCLKVYTHKRRKSLHEKKLKSIERIGDSLKEPTSTCCIDLSEDTSPNDQPVTLPGMLDMETSEYIWSLSSESIQYVVGCTINQSSQLIVSGKESSNYRDSVHAVQELDNVVVTSNDQSVRQMKELFSVDNENLDITTRPVLRRSVRINQLENDDSINNNSASTLGTSTSKIRDKLDNSRREDFSGNNGLNVTSTRVRRKVCKNSDSGGISDENNVVTTSQSSLRKNTNNSRSLRSATSKHESGKASVKARSTFSRNDRDERKTKLNGKSKGEKTEKAESTDCNFFVPARLNTIASVDRALWGDMSDVLENRENGVTLITDYSPSKEIPFAVGLLPLRAALERMQATLDHQPRKTRSSVAPLRQEINGYRRKVAANCADSKKQINSSDNYVDATPETVCHIRIRTSEECEENRTNSRNGEIVAVCSTSENNRR